MKHVGKGVWWCGGLAASSTEEPREDYALALNVAYINHEIARRQQEPVHSVLSLFGSPTLIHMCVQPPQK